MAKKFNDIELQKFIEAKADSVRNAAYEKSKTRKTGIKIPYKLTDGEREINEDRIINNRARLDSLFIGPLEASDQQRLTTVNNYELGRYYQAKEELENNCKYGFNCIGTATDNYPEESRTVLNKDFDQNYDKYGFEYIKMEDAKPGDIVKTYNHGMIYAGRDNEGNPIFNYSDGGITEYNYKLNAHYPSPFYAAYRYIGSPQQIEKWTKEYNQKRFGGMKQDKVFKLKGGVAIPLDDKKRLFYLSGAKHEQGGIDVTPELEAEGGEVVKINPKSIKVVTAQKIMGGKSPAELVVNASSTGKSEKVFNKVFNYQENFKDRNNLNDDGTKKAELGKEQSIENETKGTYVDKLIANYITNNVNKLGKQEFIKRLHDNLIPFGYGKGIIGTVRRIYNAVNKNKQEEEVKGQLPGKWNRKMLEDSGVMDIYGEYLGIPKEDRYFSNSYVENSKYKPATSTDENVVYKTLSPLPEKLRNNIIKEGMKLKLGDIKESPIQDEAFNTYTISRGEDDKGEYISFYDKWDLNPTRGTEGSKLLRTFSSGDDQFVNLGIAKPLEFYDRIYLNDINKKELGGEMKNKKKAFLGINDGKLPKIELKPNMVGKAGQQKPNNSLAVPSETIKLRNTNKLGLTPFDMVNAGANTLGTLLNFGHALGNAEVPALIHSDLIPYTASKLNTKININDAENKIRRTTDEIIDSINKNTADSSVARNAIRSAKLRERDALVDLYVNKENEENKLINRDILNEQSARFKTIADTNTITKENEKNKYLAKLQTQENVNDAISGLTQNLAGITTNVANTLEQRNQFDKNLKVLGLTYPNLDVNRLNEVIYGDDTKSTKTKISKEEKRTQKERERILYNARKNKIKMIRQGLIKPEDI